MDGDNAHTPRDEAPEARDQGGTRRGGFRQLRAVGFTSLAIVLCLLLADTAAETLINGSPARWWVAAIVATYFAAIVMAWRRGHSLWQRIDWEARAATSLFVFLGLVTITVWLPGGIANGVRMLGQATSTLLIIITVMAVAFSGMTLMRPRYPHPAMKWAIVALAVYAVIAFLRALPAGTSYPDLFRGESFWRLLPRWVQGAFIGAFGLVPAAILYQVISSLLRAPGITLHNRGVQALALSMSLVIAIAGLEGTQGAPISKAGLGPIVFARDAAADGTPIGAATQFPAGIKKISAVFHGEGLKANDVIGTVWYRGTEKVSGQKFPAADFVGAPWIVVDQSFSSGLTPGSYRLELSLNGTVVQTGTFEVRP